MAKQELKNIFLSASIPVQERDRKYKDTADIIAIRDAVIALATIVLPHHRIVWGGHPSITPLVNYVMQKHNVSLQDHVKLYQSLWFEDKFPLDNNDFKNIIFTEKKMDKQSSIQHMRSEMFLNNDFVAGVFIGGMDGVEVEFEMFRKNHPKALLLPIASTGAAASIIYKKLSKSEGLETDYAYTHLFKELLIKKI